MVYTGSTPGFITGFNNEGGHAFFILISMRLKPAMLCIDKGKGKRIERLLRSQPNEATAPGIDIRLERIGVARPDATVDAVGSDHQIRIIVCRQGLVIVDYGFEHQFYPKVQAALLQDIEHLLATNADKAVSAAADGMLTDMNINIVPVVELANDLFGRGRIGLFQILQRGVRKYDAPAEGIERPVPLNNRHPIPGIAFFHQQSRIQTCGAATDTYDIHDRSFECGL